MRGLGAAAAERQGSKQELEKTTTSEDLKERESQVARGDTAACACALPVASG